MTIICSQIVYLRSFNRKFEVQTIKLSLKKKKICSLLNGRVTNLLRIFHFKSIVRKIETSLNRVALSENQQQGSRFVIFINCNLVPCIVILH